jgi:hypothetical protein
MQQEHHQLVAFLRPFRLHLRLEELALQVHRQELQELPLGQLEQQVLVHPLDQLLELPAFPYHHQLELEEVSEFPLDQLLA